MEDKALITEAYQLPFRLNKATKAANKEQLMIFDYKSC